MSSPGEGESGWPLSAPPHRAPEPGDPATVGPYRIEGVLGEGGLGRVYVGRTPAGIAVAIKVVHRKYAADTGFRARLERELTAVRGVQGLYLVPVVHADPRAEQPWLASAHVAGPSLQHAVTERGPGSPEAVLRLVAGVAEALQSLHAAGIVHRDLKPANVLLTTDGPRLTDYGISHAADGTSVTGTGALTGTPAYLSPEYIRGEEVSGAADVFALGLLGYFAATGRLAFGGGHSHAVTYRIMEREPDLEGCPEPIRDIVVACLHKDPTQRPVPAEIIERCCAATGGHIPAPMATQPAPVPTLPTESVPTHAAAVPASLATQPTEPAATRPALPGPPGYSPPSHQPPPGPRAPGPRGLSRRRLLLGAAGLAGAAAVGVAVPLLWPDDDSGGDSGGDRPVTNGPYRLAATIKTRQAYLVNGMAFSPDGRLLATAGGDIRLWDVASGKQRAAFGGDWLNHGLAFSPDGRLLASVEDDGPVRLWDVASGEVQVFVPDPGDVGDLVFSPDGRLLATTDGETTVWLWDVPSGRQRAVLSKYGGGNVAFHPGGQLLVSASTSTVSLWDVPSGRHREFVDGHEFVSDVAYSPDGTILAVGDAGRIVFWDTAVHGQQSAVLGNEEGAAGELVFGADGRLLAAAGDRVVVWDVATRKRYATFDTDGSYSTMAFSSTGTLAISRDGEVKVWERA